MFPRMRTPTWAAPLALAACWTPNPWFEVDAQTGASASDSGTADATTATTGPDGAASSEDPGSAAADVTTSPVDPTATTAAPDLGACEFAGELPVDPQMYAAATMRPYDGCAAAPLTVTGALSLAGGALKIYSSGGCDEPKSGTPYLFGVGYPLPDHDITCATAKFHWPAAGDCRVAALEIRDALSAEPAPLLYLGVLGRTPPNFIYTPEVVERVACGCPDCCAEGSLDAGGTVVGPGETRPVTLPGPGLGDFELRNFRSHVTDACVDAPPPAGEVAQWLAWRG